MVIHVDEFEKEIKDQFDGEEQYCWRGWKQSNSTCSLVRSGDELLDFL